MKSCFGSCVPALGPSQRAQTALWAGLMDVQTPLSLWEFPCSPEAEGSGSVRMGLNPHRSLHSTKTFLTAWEPFFCCCLIGAEGLWSSSSLETMQCCPAMQTVLLCCRQAQSHVIPFISEMHFQAAVEGLKKKSWDKLIFVNVKLFIPLNYSTDWTLQFVSLFWFLITWNLRAVWFDYVLKLRFFLSEALNSIAFFIFVRHCFLTLNRQIYAQLIKKIVFKSMENGYLVRFEFPVNVFPLVIFKNMRTELLNKPVYH